jgi:tetratricopeptide (TPR) repeat protein
VTVDRDELTAERDFLLKSLDDLDAELLAGNIDPDTYRTLHDDYTARASAVITSLKDGVERSRTEPRRLRAVTAAGIVIGCVLIAVLLARAIGTRQPGQQVTGGDAGSPTATVDPNSYQGHIAKARDALSRQDFETAVQQYTAAARLDPTQAEPLAYRGFISTRLAEAVDDKNARNTLVQTATSDLNQATLVNPNFIDAWFFKGYLLYRVQNRPADAVAPLRRYLQLAPQGDPQRVQVQQLLAQAQHDATPAQP